MGPGEALAHIFLNEMCYFYLNNNNQLLILPMVPLLMWRGCDAARYGSQSALLSIVMIMVVRGGWVLTSKRKDASIGEIGEFIATLSSDHLF